METLLRQKLAAYGIDTLAFLPFERCRVILPRRLPDHCRTAALFLMPYHTGAYPERNVSLYAVPRDYHLFFKTLADDLGPALVRAFPGDTFDFFCDSSPIDEVSAAVDAGLGVRGRNGLLIHEKYGSYVFIGTILTSRTVTVKETEKAPRSCLGCGACERACAYLAGKGGACLSEMNQRKKLDPNELETVRAARVRWGCDVCQEVCPMNRNVPVTPIRFFHESTLPVLTEERLARMDDAAFSERAYAWRGRKTIARNIAEADDAT